MANKKSPASVMASPAAQPALAAARLWPPRRVLVSVASLVAAIVLVRAEFLEPVVGSIVDQAVRNIITLILAFSALVSLLLWFVRESGHAQPLKQMVLGGLLGAVVVAAGALRIERVSGDLVPEFNWRWAPPRDRLLPKADLVPKADGGSDARPGAEPATTVPWSPTAEDFPRFLGPAGDASLPGPAVAADWQATPPREVWRRAIGAGWSGFAVCAGNAVTLEQRGDEEIVSCLSIVDGRQAWAVPIRGRHETVLGGVGPRSTPTIRDGVVYAAGATGWLHAIDGPTGRVTWRKNVLDDLGIDADKHAAAVAWGRSGSPLVTDTLVIVPGGGPLEAGGGAVSLVAYDRATGERRWTGGDEQISYASPELVTIGGREVVLTVNEASVAAHDPETGKRLWSFPWPGHSNSDASCSQPRVLADGRIFISKGYGVGAALFGVEPPAAGAADAGQPAYRPVWSQAGLLKTKFTNVVVHDGHAYGLSDGILECIRLADGKRIWKGGRYGQGQVLRVGEHLLVQAESGEVVLVDCASAGHAVRGRLAALDGQTWNNPTVVGDRLLVRNAAEAACYTLPVRNE
jgi:outer membrane protein assembly factor BamB